VNSGDGAAADLVAGVFFPAGSPLVRPDPICAVYFESNS
jgi:hypothetical protein